MEEKSAFVYCITNNVNGLRYIGVSKNPILRFKKHCQKPSVNRRSILSNAIQKYGSEQFELKVLLKSTQAYCYEMEQKIIKAFVTRSPDGYNITAGGEGYKGFSGENHPLYGTKRPKELCEHLSRLFTGRPITQEQKEKISNTLKGKKQPPEVIEKRRLKLIGKKRTEEMKAKSSALRTGKKHTESSKENMRLARNNRENDAEALAKQSNSMKAKWANPVYREKIMLARQAKAAVMEVKNVK